MSKRALAAVGLVVVAIVLVITLLAFGLRSNTTMAARTAPESDATLLAALSQQAYQRAAQIASGPVLGQIDVVPQTKQIIFEFRDAAATFEVDVIVPAPDSPPSQWQTRTLTVTPLLDSRQPPMNLNALKVGPSTLSSDLVKQWPGCDVRSLILFGSGDNLQWTGFCNLSDGRLANGSVDNETGTFHPSPAPLAFPPPTATPQ